MLLPQTMKTNSLLHEYIKFQTYVKFKWLSSNKLIKSNLNGLSSNKLIKSKV